MAGIILAGLVIPHVAAQTTYTVTVLVTGIPSTLSTNIYVDGSVNGTMVGGQTSTFTFSTLNNPHVISVDSYVPNSLGSNGTRYFVEGANWSFDAPANHIFTYSPQYYLTVRTTYSSPTGQAWYNSGTVAHATVKEQEVDEGQGTRYLFTGWSGGASGTGLTSNDISMTQPWVAVANWKTQFYLAVESDPPNVTNLQGSGWNDAGTEANFSAPAVVPASDNTRLKFDHWSGDALGQSPSGTVLVDRPKTVKANFLAQYLLQIQYDPAIISSKYNESHAGWYDANSNAQLGPAPSTINLSSVERLRFNGWVDNGQSSTSPSYTVLVDQPRVIILSYVTQYYVDVRSSQGSVIGAGWYDEGATANITAAAGTQIWPMSYTLTGWRLDPSTGNLVKSDDSWALKVDRSYVVEAQWSFDYFPFMILTVGSALAIVVFAGFILAYKRGGFKPGGPLSRSPKPRPAPKSAWGTRVCATCGNDVPSGAVFCAKCGASMVAAPVLPLDEKVYDYIVKHEGVISLSTASTDLGMSVEELKEITERLKKQGRLSQ